MLSKRLRWFWIWSRRYLLSPIDRRILKNVLHRGRSYPGDIIKSLRLSQNIGLRKIFSLRDKGFLMVDETARIRLNPDRRKQVKVMTESD